ncbi:MAG TPA: hypothetical protein VJP85_05985 [Candidatus Baltobacteraceae bacterium]|nr:hypothetical protein [Candidatus Baltobacteraceae bacterium]
MIAELHFRTRRIAALALAGAVSALTGCSSSAHDALPTPQTKSLAPVSFSIAWPSSAGQSAARKPQFVSPSAQSALVTVNADPSLSAFVNKGSSALSSLALQAPVGTDTFVVSLYDAPQTSAGAPSGTLLGQVTVVQPVVAGTLNTVSAVVNGIVRSVTIDPLPNQPYLASTRGGYAVVGPHSITLAVTPRDADGNAIVPPGIAPGVTLQTNSGNSYFAVLPGSGPSQFNIVATAQAPAGYTGTLTARATDTQNTTVTTTSSIAQRSEVFVAYASGSVLAYDDAGTPVQLASGAFSGLQKPVSLAYDPSDQTMFVADSGSGTIHAFDTDGNPRSGFTPSPIAGVTSVAWSSRIFQDQILGVSSASAIIASSFTGGATGDTATLSPFAVTSATGGAYVPPSATQSEVWLVSNASTQQLDAYTLYGAAPFWGLQHVPLAPVTGTPGQILASLDGTTAWVSGTVSGSGELWRLPLTASAPPAIAVADPNLPAELAYDSALDRIFVAESSAGTVAAYAPDLTLDPTIVLRPPSSAGVSNPQGVAVAY